MAGTGNICSLDYLAGTMATAYKGVITSLVAKDFCISGEEGEATLKGTILSMPEGNYQACLMHGGSELARTDLKAGFFELKVEAGFITGAGNLQIDIVQNGRHIGTFLLRREKKGEFFLPATELSEELRGIDLKLLTAEIGEKVGLLKKAEAIVAKILSPKKDWRKLSEEINSFASDVFWAERGTFYRSYPILVRYCRLSCEKLESDKSLSNLLGLIELPLEEEEDGVSLRGLVETWLQEIRDSAVDLGLRPGHAEMVLKSIHDRFPGVDGGFALNMLISSLKEKAERFPAMEDKVLDTLKDVLPDSDYNRLVRYEKKRELVSDIAEIEALSPGERYGEILGKSGLLRLDIPDELDMVKDFFAAIGKNLKPETAERTVLALMPALEGFRASSPEVSRKAAAETAGFIRRLVSMGLAGTCESLLRRIGSGGLMKGEDLVLDPEMAHVLLQSGKEDLLGVYKDTLKKIIIPAPGISGFSSDTWAEISNPLHIERLRKFMRIIGLDSVRFRDVLVHVICNLHVSGVFIPDEALFQREISAYLNSAGFGDNFLLNHMLLQRLPVYFNEVGATGKIRDYTTEIDSWGNDTVLYFLRKQVHVNASNYNVSLVGKIMDSWAAGDPSLLRGAVPEDMLQRVDAKLFSQYSAAVRPFFESLGLLEGRELRPERLLGITEEKLLHGTQRITTTDEIKSKILLLCRIYREIVKKYTPVPAGIDGEDVNGRFPPLIEKIRELKKIILSPEKTRPEESLYFKRHIAFGIPSVMGSYHEAKFNAMRELLRNEEMVRVGFEKIASETEVKRGDFGGLDPQRWVAILSAMKDLFDLLGLGNFQVDELLAILKTNRLYASQVADMLGLWRKELTWIVGSFRRTFYGPLTDILEVFPRDDLPGHLREARAGAGDAAGKAANIIMRDILGGIVGPIELDNILDRFIAFLNSSVSGGDRIFTPGVKDEPGREFLALDELSDIEVMKLAPMMGTKAKNLAYLKNRGLPVPAGVVFLSGGKDSYGEYTESAGFASALKRAVKGLEEKTGSVFGGGEKPLFLSVRSGSYVSMPGILSTVLYCGMNSKTVDAYIASGDAWTAWDSYRRFLFHYGTVIHGLDEKVFEDVARRFLPGMGREKTEDLEARQMKQLAGLYLEELEGRGLGVPEDVYEQLREAVKSVYSSWHSEKAGQFRKALRVSEHWGTAVILMEMIAGNAEGAGASVFFTREPSTLERGISGDTRERATGDDLVYGRLINRPLKKQPPPARQKSLEEEDPELFCLHLELARRIEEAMRGLPQEVEAAYIRNRDGKRTIYVLQTRRMEIHRGFKRRFSDVCRMEESIIGRGAGVHGGALSGIATFTTSPEHIRKVGKEGNVPVILLRKTASTDDVALMPDIDGIITSAGGATSHASILAQKFDLAAVVGCTDMVIKKDEKGEYYADIGDYTVTEGAVISIDGSTGLVYSGTCLLPGAD